MTSKYLPYYLDLTISSRSWIVKNLRLVKKYIINSLVCSFEASGLSFYLVVFVLGKYEVMVNID